MNNDTLGVRNHFLQIVFNQIFKDRDSDEESGEDDESDFGDYESDDEDEASESDESFFA